MLTSLLPGIRELRVPLATGYLWLVALAIAIEPHVPGRAEARGLAATLYRLADASSVLGVGVALSFVAYLVGSLSVGLFSWPLRGLFRHDLPAEGHVWSAFRSQTADGIERLAVEARTGLDRQLALAEVDVSAFIANNLPGQRRSVRAPRWIPSMRRTPRSGPVASRTPTRLSGPPRDRSDLGRLRRAIVDDLDLVLTTRLLGRDADLYSAIDRHRAEVEFRLGLVPPVIALTVVVASRVGPAFIPIPLILGLVVSLGLHWDALNQQRRANAIMVDALADRRVSSPALERLEAKARDLAGQSKVEIMEFAALSGAAAIGRALAAAKKVEAQPLPAVGGSGLAGLVGKARERVKAMESTFPRAVG
ncbi:MAG: hypothetical protein M3271_11565, partial [Actinomycetota bacterium]|nr:hypothetical protein [Actinomycetota bacterium]